MLMKSPAADRLDYWMFYDLSALCKILVVCALMRLDGDRLVRELFSKLLVLWYWDCNELL